jgi:hypothetical protein
MQFTKLPCFQHLNWHPERTELRQFAWAMLVGFALLGLLAAARAWSFGSATWLLWLAGAALAGGALVPGLGRYVYLFVYVPVSMLGYVVSHLVLTLIFFLVFAPLGALLNLLGYDLLQRRQPRGQSNWRALAPQRSNERYYHQF